MPTDPLRSGARPQATLGPDDLRWLRALARRLARSSDEAEDLVQEAWLAAEQTTATPTRSRRAWLGGVLRNRERMHRRSEARRRRREAFVQPSVEGRAPGSEADLELHRQRVLSTVREALDELDEGDRALLLARYCDERLAPELAERLGLPASTVRTRLSRATARVRRSLDERWGGDRQAWAPAVLALPSPPAPGPALTGWRALVMSTVGTKIAIAVVAVLTGVGIWVSTRGHGEQGPAEPETASEDPAAARATLAARKRAEHTPLDRSPASLSGRVLAADTGQPVAGALVMITQRGPLAPTITPRLLTGADGTFALEGLPAGRYSVTAAALGHLPTRHAELELQPGTATHDLELRLGTGGNVVDGIVTDIGGGPVEGALVQAHRSVGITDEGRASAFGTLTDAEGRYALTLPDGGWSIEAGGEDYTAEVRHVRLEQGPGRADFALVPGAEIHGTVVERGSGKPVAGAVVTFGKATRRGASSSSESAKPHETTVSDAQGRFRLRPLAPARYALFASAPGLATAAGVRVHAAIGEEITDVVLPVDPAFDASGFVVEKGDPSRGLGGVRIALMGTDLQHWTETEPDGYFELPGLLPGSYVVMFEGGGVIPSGLEHRLRIEDANVDDAVFELERGATVRGRVEPPSPGTVRVRGRAEQGGFEIMLAAMKVQDAVARVAEDGSFTIDGVPRGEWKVVAEGDDGSHGEAEIDVPAEGLEGVAVSLAPRSRVSGVVLDGEGRPVPGLTVRLEDEPDPEVPAPLRRKKLVGSAVTATDGSFTLVGVAPGVHGLAVADPRLQPVALLGAAPTTVEAIGGEDVADLELRVELPHGRIAGLVAGPDGEPIADAWVVATAESERWGPFESGHGMTTLTQADGRFVLEGLADRRYTLHVRGPDADTRGTVEGVSTGATVSIALESLATLEGVVTQGGAPVTQFQLDAGELGGAHGVISLDGTFTVDRLEPGEHRVAVSTKDGAASTVVTVEPGGVARVELELGAWGSIEGIALSPEGTPLVGAELVVYSDSGQRHAGERMLDTLFGTGTMKTDAQGRFAVDGIGPGEVRISFGRGIPHMSGHEELGTHVLTLQPGQALDLGSIVVHPPTVDR